MHKVSTGVFCGQGHLTLPGVLGPVPLPCAFHCKGLELLPQPTEEDSTLDSLHQLATGQAQGDELAHFRLMAPPSSLPRQEVAHVPVLGVSLEVIIGVLPGLGRSAVLQRGHAGLANAWLCCVCGSLIMAGQVGLRVLARRDVVEVPSIALAFVERLPITRMDVMHLLLVAQACQLCAVVPDGCVHPPIAEHGPRTMGQCLQMGSFALPIWQVPDHAPPLCLWAVHGGRADGEGLVGRGVHDCQGVCAGVKAPECTIQLGIFTMPRITEPTEVRHILPTDNRPTAVHDRFKRLAQGKFWHGPSWGA